MPEVPTQRARAGGRCAPSVLLLPPAPEDHKRLAELAHLRIRLDVSDELRDPERAVLLTRIAELEKKLRAAGLIAPAPKASPGPSEDLPPIKARSRRSPA